MRRDYNKHLLMVIAGVIGGAGILFATTRGKKYKQPELNKTTYVQTIIDFEDKKIEKEEIYETKPQEHQQNEAMAEKVKFPEPQPSDDPQDKPADIPKKDVNSGMENQKGEGGMNEIKKGDPEPPGPPTPPIPPVDPPGPVIADEPAEFPGGMDKLPPWMEKNFRYPEIARELGLQGKCYTKFVVSKTGEISDVTVERGVTDCKECDKEALRVIRNMPRWTPGKVNGRPVNSYFHLPISFKLATN